MDNNKMILAILSGDDSADVVSELNKNGFYVTVLSTAGGFLKKRSATLLIGTSADKVEKVQEILKAKAGRRKENVYYHAASFSEHDAGHMVSAPAAIPVEQEVGGVTVFVLDMAQMNKF